MGVVAQTQAEVTDIFRIVFGLALRTQHQLVDQAGLGQVADLSEQRIEVGGAEYFRLR